MRRSYAFTFSFSHTSRSALLVGTSTLVKPTLEFVALALRAFLDGDRLVDNHLSHKTHPPLDSGRKASTLAKPRPMTG
jgi:hypothetical protein